MLWRPEIEMTFVWRKVSRHRIFETGEDGSLPAGNISKDSFSLLWVCKEKFGNTLCKRVDEELALWRTSFFKPKNLASCDFHVVRFTPYLHGKKVWELEQGILRGCCKRASVILYRGDGHHNLCSYTGAPDHYGICLFLSYKICNFMQFICFLVNGRVYR